ncbi:hypothetical protein NQ317_001543 [Molorchus minor]|uniref:Transposase n=1 Tax=Molorchus minor TaxID=1323400 RepID=A0ABQ9JQU9_9CUCU|nr:hypothetical protein NQ317_001543 [Molorchus minor]
MVRRARDEEKNISNLDEIFKTLLINKGYGVSKMRDFLTFQLKKTGDYHEDMNSAVFKGWFKRILAKLPLGSVVVMDTSSFSKNRAAAHK